MASTTKPHDSPGRVFCMSCHCTDRPLSNSGTPEEAASHDDANAVSERAPHSDVFSVEEAERLVVEGMLKVSNRLLLQIIPCCLDVSFCAPSHEHSLQYVWPSQELAKSGSCSPFCLSNPWQV